MKQHATWKMLPTLSLITADPNRMPNFVNNMYEGYWKQFGVLRSDWGKNSGIIKTRGKFHQVNSYE